MIQTKEWFSFHFLICRNKLYEPNQSYFLLPLDSSQVVIQIQCFNNPIMELWLVKIVELSSLTPLWEDDCQIFVVVSLLKPNYINHVLTLDYVWQAINCRHFHHVMSDLKLLMPSSNDMLTTEVNNIKDNLKWRQTFHNKCNKQRHHTNVVWIIPVRGKDQSRRFIAQLSGSTNKQTKSITQTRKKEVNKQMQQMRERNKVKNVPVRGRHHLMRVLAQLLGSTNNQTKAKTNQKTST